MTGCQQRHKRLYFRLPAVDLCDAVNTVLALRDVSTDVVVGTLAFTSNPAALPTAPSLALS